MVIGYQGSKYSNNYQAAMHFKEVHQWADAELRPMVTGENLFRAMLAHEVDYGVFAYSTDLIGQVQENLQAREKTGIRLNYLERYVINVRHCLYKKSPEVPDDAITVITSHPEAIRECQHTLEQMYPNAEFVPTFNSGYAANALKTGELPETTAIVSNSEAGEKLGLTPIRMNCMDLEENGTSFMLVTLAE